MKLNGKLGALFLALVLCSANPVQAQIKIGGGNKIKNPVKTDKGNVAVTKYDKAMKAGQKAEEAGNLKEAYKSYNEALEEKYGDYSAKSSAGRVEKALKDDYLVKMRAANEGGDCETMVNLADESLALFEVWSDATYYKGLNEKCKENAATNAAYEKNKLSDADCQKLKADAEAEFVAQNYSKALELLDKGYATKCITSAGSDSDYRGMQIACQNMVQAEEAKYKREKVEDEGITGDVHQSNIKKIVFSTSKISKESPNSSSFKNSFTTADNIYGRVFLDQSLDNAANDIGRISQATDYSYRITVSGHNYPEFIDNQYVIQMKGEIYESWTTFELGLNPASSDVKSYRSLDYYSLFWKHIYYLPEGSFDVKIELVFDVPEDREHKFGAEQILAEGSFNINVKNSDKPALGKKLCDPLPNGGGLNSSTHTAQMIKLTTGKWPGQTPKKAIVTSDAWNVHKDYLGNILDRTFTGVIVVKHEKEDMYQVLDVSFIQKYQGGGKYGALQFEAVSGGDFIAKELVK